MKLLKILKKIKSKKTTNPNEKKITPFFFTLISFFTATSQSDIGYFHDNYAGVQSVVFNPASIADSRFKTDINLLSISGSVQNDLYGVKLFDVYKDGYYSESIITPTDANNALVNFDIMEPSFMFNIAPKHTLAVFSRVRSVSNFRNVNGNLVNEINKGLDQANDFNLTGGSSNLVSHSWREVGLSYATVLYQNNQHFIKGGLTAKYLQGGINGYFQGKNVVTSFKKNTTSPELSTLESSGEITVRKS